MAEGDPTECFDWHDGGDCFADRVEQHALACVEQQGLVVVDQELVEGEAGRADIGNEGRQAVDPVSDLVDECV